MIRIGDVAERQLAALVDHYEACNRPEASQALIAAVQLASASIERDPMLGLPAPRPYPNLASTGRLWIKAGRYWIAYTTDPLMIQAVFFDAADIPGRLSADRD